MKSHALVVVVLVVVAVSVVASYFTATFLEAPRDRLERTLDEEVERAQRMLFDYRPDNLRLATALQTPATQPANLPPEKWQEYQQRLDNPDDPVGSLLQGHKHRLDQLSAGLGRLGGRPAQAPPLPADAADAYEGLRRNLEENTRLVEQALQGLQKAIRTSEGSGESEVRGDRHPAATRLEAVLIYHQADLRRRQGAVQRAMADRQRTVFAEKVASWRDLDTRVHGLEVELMGSKAATSRPASGPAEAHAAVPAAQARTGQPKSAKAETPPKSRTDKGSLWQRMFQRMVGRPGAEGQAQPVPTEKPKADQSPPPTDVGQAADQVAATKPEETPAAAPEAIPPLAQRVQELQARRTAVVSEMEQAQAEAQRVGTAVADLEQRITAQKAKAAEAQKQMLAMEQAGVDPAKPDAIKAFTEAYNAASKTCREASQEAAILEFGSVRNARPDAQDEDKMLTAPLVPAEPDQKMVPERGLTALKSDLRSAQAVAETSKGLLGEIDRQIAELTEREKELQAQITALREAQARLAKESIPSVAAAIAHVIQAEGLETQALELATGPGPQAVARAKRAADQWISEARQLNAENQDSPNPRLRLIADGRFVPGHAQILAGDLAFVVALTQAERAEDGERHEQMLRMAAELGLNPAKLLPEGQAPDTASPTAIEPSAAGSTAEQARAAATEAAQQALQSYEEASAALGQLWVLNTNIAAAHYLLASLSSDPKADKHLQEARQRYQQAIRDQADRPEAEVYRRIVKAMD